MPKPKAVYEAALVKSLNQMLDRPDGVDSLSEVELHLLTNDSIALRLDPEAPTHAPTSDQSLRTPVIPHEHGHPGANYVDANMAQWYETSHIEAALTQPDSQPRDTFALAQFCAESCQLDKCYGDKIRDAPKEFIIALALYRYCVKYQVWPTSGEI